MNGFRSILAGYVFAGAIAISMSGAVGCTAPEVTQNDDPGNTSNLEPTANDKCSLSGIMYTTSNTTVYSAPPDQFNFASGWVMKAPVLVSSGDPLVLQQGTAVARCETRTASFGPLTKTTWWQVTWNSNDPTALGWVPDSNVLLSQSLITVAATTMYSAPPTRFNVNSGYVTPPALQTPAGDLILETGVPVQLINKQALTFSSDWWEVSWMASGTVEAGSGWAPSTAFAAR